MVGKEYRDTLYMRNWRELPELDERYLTKAITQITFNVEK